ncbi:HPr family phosphocarrier protein [Metabacillus sp. RGM 3146]|uniref:HPr family phosphocarrier protein n=1 Tax=Metabacillus sp. RGM 3146 TaxID=3401092 RepID=UPI003B99A7D7
MIKMIEKTLNMQQALHLYQLANKYEGSIFLQTENHRKVNAKKLPSMVSFLLTLPKQNDISVVLNGVEDDALLMEIDAVLSEPASEKSASLKIQIH